jgi:uncharacterized membrane protein
MNFLTKLWNWLNGNKTVIGLVLLALIAQPFFKQIVPEASIWYQAIQWIAGLLAGVGAVHKLVKANTQPGPTA